MAGKLREYVALDQPVLSQDGSGGMERSWDEVFKARAEFRYVRGGETVIGGGLTGTAQFKVRLRSSVHSRAITAEFRLRDLHRSVAYNVREVDAITDRDSVWLIIENGVRI